MDLKIVTTQITAKPRKLKIVWVTNSMMIDFLLKHKRHLSRWENEFISNLYKLDSSLDITFKQEDILMNIYNRVLKLINGLPK